MSDDLKNYRAKNIYLSSFRNQYFVSDFEWNKRFIAGHCKSDIMAFFFFLGGFCESSDRFMKLVQVPTR